MPRIESYDKELKYHDKNEIMLRFYEMLSYLKTNFNKKLKLVSMKIIGLNKSMEKMFNYE